MISPAPVKSAAEAGELARHFAEVMDALIGVVQQETDLVRAGRLGAAAKLEQPKADLTRLYILDALRLRRSREALSHLVPARIEELQQRHEQFRALLQINLTVLATAHAVSEGIVRGVSGVMARKAATPGYGASGQTVAPSRSSTSAPLAVSRTL
ncbi:MAG TPA: hypothetical protein VFB88_15635 [Xanthobacteraceae bacterium]|nr:hypothetical protein [Xanthobacteraceae bacterium]